MSYHRLFSGRTSQVLLALLAAFALLLATAGLSIQQARAQTTNLALNKPVTCSSIENAGTACANAVDGNASTRWASAAGVDPQFIQVDLGATYNITRVVLTWETAYATGYQIQVSGAATGPWTNIFSTTTGNGATDDLTGLSGSGRYVRMNGTARATQWGYSLWEFAVYGTSGVLTPTRTSTSPSTLPDLTITSITYAGSNPPCANQPRDNVVVSNIGGGNAGSFVVSFGPSMTQTVSSLAAGASVTLIFPAIGGPAVTATADSTNLIAEGNENNNSMSAGLVIPTQAPTCTPTRTATVSATPSLTPTGPGMLPDLMISSAITAPQGWTGGCANDLIMGVRVTIRNAGPMAAGAFVVDVSGTQQTVSAGLAAGASISLWFARTGSLVVTADSTNLVGESNEGNNTLAYVTVTATPPVVCTRTPTPTVTPTRVGCGTVVVVTLTPTPTYTATPRTATATATTCGPIFVTVTNTPTVTRTPTRTPTSPPSSTNLALNKPVVCSSTENTGTSCANAVDGNLSTRWASAFSDPQWIRVDLGASYNLSSVVLRWEAAYARAFQIQVSNDTTTWTSLYSTTTGTGGTQTLPISGSGRYIRMNGTARATAYGYSLWEFEVYGTSGPTNTPSPTNTSTAVPGADFVGSPLTGSAPLAVQFTHINSSTLTSCTWSFGDGSSQNYAPGGSFSSCPSVTHSYTAAGSYSVSLSVMKTTGVGNSMTKPNYVQVGATTSPVSGSVLVSGGVCCVGGVAGSTININTAFSATSSAAAVTQMRVATRYGGGCVTEATLAQSAWEPFVTTKSFPVSVAINWVGFYVTVQYRDASANLSPVYCDDISVEGMPPTPTWTPIP